MSSLNEKQIKLALTPERGINIVCLLITAASPVFAIGWQIGLPTGAVAAFGLIAVMNGQQSENAQERRQAYMGAWIIRGFVICFEQMAYQDQFDSRDSLPFQWSAITWSWAAVLFMAVIDLWAYYRTATKAQALADAAEIADSIKRIEERDAADRQAKADQAERDRLERLELARIKTGAETTMKIAEEQRKIAEAKAKVERTKLESVRKAEEEQRNAEEAARKISEEQRKAAEAAIEAQREKWRLQKAKNKKGNHQESDTENQTSQTANQ